MLHKSRKRAARDLFFQTDLTQQKIAQLTGISPKTLYLWIKKDDWQKIKDSAICSPGALCEQYYAQLHDLNTRISQREEGFRNPTPSEAEVIRKLSVTIKNLGKQIGLAPSINMTTAFIDYIAMDDPALAYQVSEYANNYFANKTDPLVMDFYTEENYQEDILAYKEEMDQIHNDEIMAASAEQERIGNNSEIVGNLSVINRKSIGNNSEIFSSALEPDNSLNARDIGNYDTSANLKNTG